MPRKSVSEMIQRVVDGEHPGAVFREAAGSGDFEEFFAPHKQLLQQHGFVYDRHAFLGEPSESWVLDDGKPDTLTWSVALSSGNYPGRSGWHPQWLLYGSSQDSPVARGVSAEELALALRKRRTRMQRRLGR